MKNFQKFKVEAYKNWNLAKKYLLNRNYRRMVHELKEDYCNLRLSVKNWSSQKPNNLNNGYYAVVSFSNLPFFVKFHAITLKAMQLKGFKAMAITMSGNKYAEKVFKLFNVDEIIFWDKFSKEHAPANNIIQDILITLLPKNLSVESAMEISYMGVDVGKHALSMTCRKRIEGRLNLNDPLTKEMFLLFLSNAISNTIISQQLFNKYQVKKMLVRDSGYNPNGQIFEVGLNRGIDSVVVEFGQKKSSWIFKRHTIESKDRHYFSLSPSTWDDLKSLPITPFMESKIDKELAGRYSASSDEDTRRLQSGKTIKTREEVQAQLKLDPNKKTAIVFSHVAWDATFFYGKCLFTDYEDWLYQTVDFINNNCPELNWIVKVHPYNAFKLQRENIKTSSEERLLANLMPFNNHVILMMPDTDINSQSLFSVTDFALTVNGSVGFEYPLFGINAIVAGTGRYEGMGFTEEPQTKAEYFNLLKNILTISPLTNDQIELAKKHYYYNIIGKQIMFDDVAPMVLLKIHEADSSVHNNITITSSSLSDFSKKESIVLWSNWMADNSSPDLIKI